MNYKKEETPDLTEISFRQGKSNMELAHSRFNEIFTSKVYPIGEGGELKPGDCVADVKNICWFAHTNTHTHTHARDTHTHTHTHRGIIREDGLKTEGKIVIDNAASGRKKVRTCIDT